MNNSVAVVIPYYHSRLTELEKISYEQCIRVLSEYPIILLLPDGMQGEEYPQDKNLMYEKVPAEWLKSVNTYNKMMLNMDFYRRFEEYEYLLIYQLDAFVFEDRLEEFCEYGFDYIGAPWLMGARCYRNFQRCVYYVGNGGFSLRRVQSFIQILSKADTAEVDYPEDLFWASYAGKDFRVAPLDIALQFAFEQNVRKCWELNDKRMPFGCHAWEKHDFSFWKPYIMALGYHFKEEFIGDNMDAAKSNKDLSYLEIEEDVLLESCMSYLHCDEKEIYIWGSGIWGKECGWLLKKCGIDKFCYIDVSPERQQKKLWDASIRKPEMLLENKEENIMIIIAVRDKEQEILDVLENVGYQYQQQVFFYKDWTDKLLEEKNEEHRR